MLQVSLMDHNKLNNGPRPFETIYANSRLTVIKGENCGDEILTNKYIIYFVLCLNDVKVFLKSYVISLRDCWTTCTDSNLRFKEEEDYLQNQSQIIIIENRLWIQ